MITLGIIADTHIPDRLPRLHPQVLPQFQKANVTAILHAGDVCVPRVISELETVAPVHAVRGNRDWVSLGRLPIKLVLEYGGVRIGLTHGHGNMTRYVGEKVRNMLFGLDEKRYIDHARSFFSDVDVVVFGHLHRSVLEQLDGKLIFDPGSACCVGDDKKGPSVGLLHIHTGGKVEAEVINLTQG